MAGSLIDDVNVATTIGRRSDGVDIPTTDEIVTIRNAALRNLWMTHTYADLAHRLRPTFGVDQTWCSFATWTSVTAGAIIRCPQLPRMVDQLLVGSEDVVDMILERTAQRTHIRRRAGLMGPLDRSTLERLVVEAIADVANRTAAYTSISFANLAPLFENLANLFESGEPLDDVDGAVDSIGVPAEDAAPYLRLAFHHYVRAAQPATGAHERAQFVLAANTAVAIHDQRIAQNDIAASLDVGQLSVEAALAKLMHDGLGPLRSVLAGSINDDIVEDVEDLWHHVSSRLLMTLVMPTEVLHVGRDIPMLDTGERFPVMLDELDQPILLQIIDEWDPTDGTGVGARSWQWDSLESRVGYLFNLLRSRQRDQNLLAPPLTDGDLDAMCRGEVPPLA